MTLNYTDRNLKWEKFLPIEFINPLEHIVRGKSFWNELKLNKITINETIRLIGLNNIYRFIPFIIYFM